jgi:glutathione S-transferase
MAAVLWHLEISHYNEKARWALDFKQIPHVRRAPLAGWHRARAAALTRGAQNRLPLLELEGRRIGDSTAIIEALEAYRPEPALYPGDPDDRQRALDLEGYFDEQLAPAVRRYFWHLTLPSTQAMVGALDPNAPAWRARTMRTVAPVMRPLVRRDLEITDESAAKALAQVCAAMDRLESEIGPSGYLAGDRFSVADLTGAALCTPILCPPERPYQPQDPRPELLELRAQLGRRRGGEWVREMYARHRGTSAEVAA